MAARRGLRQRGGGIWWYSYQDAHGVRRRGSTHTTRLGEAQAILDRLRAAAHAGESPVRDRRLTVGALVDRYLPTVAHLRSVQATTSILERIRERWGAMPLQRMGAYELERWQSEMLARKLSAGTLHRYLGVLKAMLARGVEWGLVPPSTLLAVRRVHAPPSEYRLRYLSVPEAQALLVELSPELRDIATLLLLTGCRPGEVLGLRWDQVDLGQGVLLLPRTKTGRREVLLSAQACEVLLRQPRAGAYVFPSPLDPTRPRHHLGTGFEAAVRRAELVGVTPYVLRHTFASWAVQDGEGLRTVQELLGHARSTTTERYAHLGREDLRAALARQAKRRRVA